MHLACVPAQAECQVLEPETAGEKHTADISATPMLWLCQTEPATMPFTHKIPHALERLRWSDCTVFGIVSDEGIRLDVRTSDVWPCASGRLE